MNRKNADFPGKFREPRGEVRDPETYWRSERDSDAPYGSLYVPEITREFFSAVRNANAWANSRGISYQRAEFG